MQPRLAVCFLTAVLSGVVGRVAFAWLFVNERLKFYVFDKKIYKKNYRINDFLLYNTRERRKEYTRQAMDYEIGDCV